MFLDCFLGVAIGDFADYDTAINFEFREYILMKIVTRQLGLTPYSETFVAMKAFTAARTADSQDELWLTQHFPVFTQGQAGKPEHLLRTTDIPLIKSDRGGQITYHGPGQIVLYTLVDIKRAGIGVRQMVCLIEKSLIETLNTLNIDAFGKPDAPGVYVSDKKIASLGLRVRQGRTYHGLALNADMDLAPFQQINPCGYAGLRMAQIRDFVKIVELEAIEKMLINAVTHRLTALNQATGLCR